MPYHGPKISAGNMRAFREPRQIPTDPSRTAEEMMRSSATFPMFIALAVLFTACNEGPTTPALGDAAFAMGGVHGPGMVPFKGYSTTTSQGPGAPGPASDPGCLAAFAANFPAQIWLPTPTIRGEFVTTQAGRSTFVGNGCIDFKNFPSGPYAIFGESVLTTPNGDLLYLRGTGVAQADFSSAGTQTIVGGTGRYAGATGTMDFQSVGNQLALPSVIEYVGVISNGRSGN